VKPLRTYLNSSTGPAWRFHVPRIWNRSINAREIPVKRKTQNVVGVFVPRLFVVVRFLCNHFLFRGFRALPSRATLAASYSIMKRSLFTLLVVLLFSSTFANSLPAQTHVYAAAKPAKQFEYGEKLHIRGVPNFGKIDDHLYRGAHPKAPGLLELKEIGITTIVDLRGEDATTIEWEEDRLQSLGIRFVHIPVSGWSPPSDKQVAQFLSIFRDHPQDKVFVHCRFGEDRTGVFVASYRIAIDNFPSDRALKEMYYFGFNGFWHPSMVSFVRQFPSRLATAPPLLPFKRSG